MLIRFPGTALSGRKTGAAVTTPQYPPAAPVVGLEPTLARIQGGFGPRKHPPIVTAALSNVQSGAGGTGEQRMVINYYCIALSREGSNLRPVPYQGTALPLSYVTIIMEGGSTLPPALRPVAGRVDGFAPGNQYQGSPMG